MAAYIGCTRKCTVINMIKHYQHIMVNPSCIFFIKHHECMMNILVNVPVIIAIKCSQHVMDMMVHGLIMILITINISRRQPSNSSRSQQCGNLKTTNNAQKSLLSSTFSFMHVFCWNALKDHQHLLLKRTATSSSS